MKKIRLLFIVPVLLLSTVVLAQDVDSLIQQADALHEESRYTDVYNLLKKAEEFAPDNFEVVWRLARAHFDLSDNSEDPATVEKHIRAGFTFAEKALEMNPNRAESHKWYGILIGRVGEIEGTKQKIKNSYKVAEHTKKAIELDPEDAANYHVMGRWHFTLADLSWVERQVASVIYAKPPQASFDKAKEYFQTAIDKDPAGIRNYVWLGKTEEQLGNKSAARNAYQNALNQSANSESDRNLQKEARELMSDL
ncbi:MAG: hypothetical protein K9N46_13795 [Candidatus Marinimicrobia bacterium]|nr:hypothetical protein [Candidatus Neomarinimicrobiota bacterium]MCF7829062.1 hypothetical protein [Candidatus Neomarinimicrobiota bacterium]MCF7881801.1 hypothetical protein [Candidatus Neomarinimicrobiota bacterium]